VIGVGEGFRVPPAELSKVHGADVHKEPTETCPWRLGGWCSRGDGIDGPPGHSPGTIGSYREPWST